MSAPTASVRVADTLPRAKPRLAGAFYLLNIVTGATAAMLTGRDQSGLGYAVNLAATASYLVVTVLFYELFKPVDKNLSLLAAILTVIGCALGILVTFHVNPLPVNNLVFFGGYCVLIGYLILRSTFLPWVIGMLMIVAGLGWLTFLSPALAHRLSPYNLAPGVLGETVLTLWLLLRGVNVARWNEQARGAAGSA